MFDAVVYLAGHNRPPRNLGRKGQGHQQPYENALVGMTLNEVPSVDTLIEVRSQLRADIASVSTLRAGLSPWILQTGTELESAAIRERPVSTSPAVETRQSPPLRKNRPEEFRRQNAEFARLLVSDCSDGDT